MAKAPAKGEAQIFRNLITNSKKQSPPLAFAK
jgi:hypothetical protein